MTAAETGQVCAQEAQQNIKLVVADQRAFRAHIKVLKDLVPEATFKVSGEGLTCVAMDPANVAMVDLKFFSDGFLELEGSGSFCVNTKQLFDAVTATDKKGTVTLQTTQNKKLVIGGSCGTTTELLLLDLDQKEQRVPELQFLAAIKCSAKDLKSRVVAATKVAEAIKLSVTAQDLGAAQICAQGDHSTYSAPMSAQVQIKDAESSTGKYSLEYLKRFVGAASAHQYATLEWGDDYPLRVVFKDTTTRVAYILAPRVDND